MELTGDKVIAAPPDVVWEALIDPEFLRRLIPGCESMTGDPASGYDIVASRSVGNMTARLTGRIDLLDAQPGRSCRLVASGQGGGAGAAKGTADIRLSPEGQGTRLGWDVRAEVEGRLASLPNFIIEAAARRVADGFVERFAAALEGRPARKGLLQRLTGR